MTLAENTFVRRYDWARKWLRRRARPCAAGCRRTLDATVLERRVLYSAAPAMESMELHSTHGDIELVASDPGVGSGSAEPVDYAEASAVLGASIASTPDKEFYYLDDESGTDDIPISPLKTNEPIALGSRNFDSHRNNDPGLTVKTGGSGVNEQDAEKFQAWLRQANGLVLEGDARAEIKATVEKHGDFGEVTAYLVDSNADGTDIRELASATITRSKNAGSEHWNWEKFYFGDVHHAFAADRYWGVKVVVTGATSDDVWFDYDWSTTFFGHSESHVFVHEGTQESPTDIVLPSDGLKVEENTDASTGVELGQLQGVDPNQGDQLTFSVRPDADGALFSFGGDDGDRLILTTPQINYETKNQYIARIRVTDAGGNFYEEVVTVQVENVNEAPTNVTDPTVAKTEGLDTTGGIQLVTLNATDEDVGDTHTYTLVGGADVDKFDLTGGNVLEFDDGALDFERQSEYVVLIRATDGGGNTFDDVLRLEVVNENETPTDIEPLSGAINSGEDTSGGKLIATLTATDPDLADTHSFSILTGADGALFSVSGANNATLKLDDGVLDIVNKSSYSVNLRATDAGGLFVDKTLTVQVVSVNNAPTGIELSNLTVSENVDTTGGFVVGALSAIDPDVGDHWHYRIVPGGDSSLFSIQGDHGPLKLSDGVLDFERRTSYEVRLEVEDREDAKFQQTFTINVQDVNEAPTGLVTSSYNLNEGTYGSPVVLDTLQAVDPDTSDTFVYSIVGGDDHKRFKLIGPNKDRLRFKPEKVDFEDQPSYEVVIRIVDNRLATHDATVTVNVTNVAEPPVWSGATHFDLHEQQDTSSGMTLTTLSVADPEGTAVALTISVGDDASAFSIGNGTNLILNDGVLDFERKTDYEVKVLATDGAGDTAERDFTVTIQDVPESPEWTGTSQFSLTEHQDTSTAVTLTTLAATDPEGTSVSFSIVGGADSSSFSLIDSNTKLAFSAGVLDFETKNSYEVTVRAEDGDNDRSERTFTVNVQDVAEAPVWSGATQLNVDEAQDTSSGLTVTTLAATDPDGNAITFSIVGGNDASKFSVGTGGTDLVLTDGVLDFETKDEYDVTVRATDGGGGTTDQAFKIDIQDVAEPPAWSGTTQFNQAESQDTSSGLTVTTLSAPDPEGTSVAYSIEGGADASLFSISNNGANLVLTAGVLDFETKTSYTVNVRATDGAGATADQTFRVDVQDVAEPPAWTGTMQFDVAELQDTSSGLTLRTLTAPDPEGTHVTYSIVGGADASSFTIGNHGKDLRLAAGVLDFESKSTYEVTVRATDGTNATADQAFVVRVQDVPEAPVWSGATQFARAELLDTSSGLVITTLAAADPDGNAVSYSIIGGADASVFSVGTNGTDLVLTDGVLDFETKNSYEVEVRATDAGGGTADRTIDVNVQNVAEAPVWSGATQFAEAELQDTSSGLTITTLAATDPDGNAVTFAIVGGADQALFTLVNHGKDLRLSDGDLDFERQSSYEVTVRANDAGGGTADRTFNINVQDIAEAPVWSGATHVALAELTDTTTGQIITTLAATDPDGNAISFTIVGGTNASAFNVGTNGTDLLLSDGVLDFETTSSYQVTVRATDTGGGTTDQGFTVDISDLAEPPEWTTSASISVDELQDTSAGLTVATLSASDPEGTAVTFAVVGGADAASFTLGGAGAHLILSDNVLDMERKASYEVTVRATDGAGATSDRSFTIAVQDVPEPPVWQGASSFDVDELQDTSAGLALTNLSAIDPEGAAVAFTVQGGADAGLFSVANGTELVLRDDVLDFEQQNTYEVVVRAVDGDGTASDRTITVSVNDINEAPRVELVNLQLAIPEDTAMDVAWKVADVVVHDDALGTNQLTLSGSDQDKFFLDGMVLMLKANTPLDFEAQTVFDVQVQVADPSSQQPISNGQGGTPVNGQPELDLSLAVENVDEAPEALDDEFVVKRRGRFSAPGVLANDTDPEGKNLKARVVQGPSDGLLRLRSNGSFVYAPRAGFKGTDTFIYAAVDPAGNRAEATVTLNVSVAWTAVSPQTQTTTVTPTTESQTSTSPQVTTDSGQQEETNKTQSGTFLPGGLHPTREVDEEVRETRSRPATDNKAVVAALPKLFSPQRSAAARVVQSRSASTSRVASDSIELADLAASPYLTYVSHSVTSIPFLHELDSVMQDVNQEFHWEQKVIGATLGLSTSVSIGYIAWMIRGGMLLSSVLSSLPAWRMVDPLPVLSCLDATASGEHDESLQALVAKSNQKLRGPRGPKP